MEYGFDNKPTEMAKERSRPNDEEQEEYYDIALSKNFSAVGRLDQETLSVMRKSLVDKISNSFISSQISMPRITQVPED